MHVIGNKGAALVSLQINDTSVCFVCSHFAAHQQNIERRNEDYRQIRERAFQEWINGEKVSYHDNPNLKLDNHDCIVWLGDLNYRINMNNQEIRDRLSEVGLSKHEKQFAYDDLLKHDQLVHQKNQSLIFQGYEEHRITFQPTYKYDNHSDVFDTSEKMRAPAYTDRVLVRGNEDFVGSIPNQIRTVGYQSHMGIKLSDHKPVSCQIEIAVSTLDRNKYAEIKREIQSELEKLENDERPSVAIEQQTLDFGTCFYKQRKTRQIVIKNNGLVPVLFHLGLPAGQNNLSPGGPNVSPINLPNWLKLDGNLDHAKNRVIEVGQSKTINVTVDVQKGIFARELTLNQTSLSAIIVFSMEGGGDKFIPVDGKFIPTIFGMSLEELRRLENTPVARLKPRQVKEACFKSQDSSKSLIDLDEAPEFIESLDLVQQNELGGVPKEFYKMCKKLTSVSEAKKNAGM